MNRQQRRQAERQARKKSVVQQSKGAVQKSPDETFERHLFGLTTIIQSKIKIGDKVYGSQGSGFYFTNESLRDPNLTSGQWIKIDGTWLVTNRHVVLPIKDGKEHLPEEFVFCFREIIDGKIIWKPIPITQEELRSRLKLHKDKSVDVALIDVHDYVNELMKDNSKKHILPALLGNNHLPDNNPIVIDVTSDIVVASYPKGFYDIVNKFPIVKSGIIASAWKFPFNGQPIFQIDAQLFPGSSGGLVISKPTNLAYFGGGINHSKMKEFVLLGVYSGEYIFYEEIDSYGKKQKIQRSYGLGNVWYSYLIPQIIKEGITYEGQSQKQDSAVMNQAELIHQDDCLKELHRKNEAKKIKGESSKI